MRITGSSSLLLAGPAVFGLLSPVAAASTPLSARVSDSAFQLLLGADPSGADDETNAPATVSEATKSSEDRGAWYFRIGGASILDHEADFEVANLSGTLTGSNSFGIRAGLGVRLNDVLALELDFGYTDLKYDTLAYSGVTAFGNPFSGTIDTELVYSTLMFGPRLDFELFDGFSLNGAATLGFALGSGKITGTESFLGNTYIIDESGDGVAFAYALRGGVEWAINNHIAIYAGLRYEGSTTMAINYDLYFNTADANITPRMLSVDFGINITF